jgi:two-component system NtrC family response regulator
MSGPAKDSARAHLLVVEDSSVFREMQSLLLGQAGFAVTGHESPQAALAAAAKEKFDLVIIDYELPEMNGEQFMHELRKTHPTMPVIFVSGTLTLELAVKLSSQGVAGIFNKPASPKSLIEKINETLFRPVGRDTAVRAGSGSPLPATSRASGGNYVPPDPVAGQLAYPPHYVVGESDKFKQFTHRLWKVRDFRSVLLLQGEPGSPFELFARDLAEISIFRDGPVMLCDAAEFEPKRLIQELAPSLLSQDAGTFILTGVELLTAEQQKTLENLLTGRDVFLPFARRFRVVLAATPALTDRLDDGSFGETLYYKISALSLTVPALREIKTDIGANARQILAMSTEAGSTSAALTFTAEALAWLEAQPWPGNYDELARTIVMALPHAQAGQITPATLEAAQQDVAHGASEPAATASAAAPATAAPAPAPVAPVPAAPAHSLFRPASATYNFSDRLTQLLGAADAPRAA